MVIAQSGERKSAADRAFSKAFVDWEHDRREELLPAKRRADAEHQAWECEANGVKNTLSRPASRKSGNSGDDRNALKMKLRELIENEPPRVVLPRLRYEDVNPESLAHCLATGWPSAALWSDEAGLVIGSQGMGQDSRLRFLALLNRLWDAKPFTQDRKQAESVSVAGRRFTAYLMLQEGVFRELLQGGKGQSRDTGFLSRYLLCQPASTIGSRPYREPAKPLEKLDEPRSARTAKQSQARCRY